MISAKEWFQQGRRVLFDTKVKAIVDKPNAHTYSVFERLVSHSTMSDEGARWLTMLPGFPDGSYGWSKVDGLIQDKIACSGTLF